MELNDILKAAVAAGAYDVHLTGGYRPLYRLRGDIAPMPGFEDILDRSEVAAMISGMLNQEQREHLADCLDLDLSYELPGHARFRVNLHTHTAGLGGVFRVVPARIPSPEEIMLPTAVQELADLPRGLVLVTGPTGSGKSTTLAVILNEMMKKVRKHLLTIEDPIEFVYPQTTSRVTQREIGQQARTFAGAMRAGLRQDPDVILVGEMRDPETISMALTAAETGHLVLSTLHTSGAAQSIHRILDTFPPAGQALVRAQLAATLKAVITQTLLPRADGLGRVAAREVLIMTPAVANMIRESQVHQIGNAMFAGSDKGMTTLDQDLARLVRLGLVHQEDAELQAVDPTLMTSMVTVVGGWPR